MGYGLTRCVKRTLEFLQQVVHFITLHNRHKLFVPSQRFDRVREVVAQRSYKSHIEMHPRTVGLQLNGQLIMQPRKLEAVLFEVEIAQVELRLEMPGVVLQGFRETVKRLCCLSCFRKENAQVAVGTVDALTFPNGPAIGFLCPPIVSLIEKEGLLER